MYDYKLIEAMAAVVMEGGFERAARVLHITQSAVSQRVKLLEEQSGQVLLTRSAPPSATTAGEAVLAHYLKVAQLEADLKRALTGPSRKGFHSLAIGVNADSLATWLIPSIASFLMEERLLIDFRVDDQEETLRFLRSGETAGCITSQTEKVQGCSMVYLGKMVYHMVSTPTFEAEWFPSGFDLAHARKAPAVLFNRRDDLHKKALSSWFKGETSRFAHHLVPSSRSVVTTILSGAGYGLVPMEQAREHLDSGALVDVVPGRFMDVPLYWQSWRLKPEVLARFSDHLVSSARQCLS
ncbi:MAG: LysR family transcriptional regulator ArgP [Desulfobacterales bacterium]|nr:LysR family transcriptional regulator ArgP [Desulfobacterales bacterium]